MVCSWKSYVVKPDTKWFIFSWKASQGQMSTFDPPKWFLATHALPKFAPKSRSRFLQIALRRKQKSWLHNLSSGGGWKQSYKTDSWKTNFYYFYNKRENIFGHYFKSSKSTRNVAMYLFIKILLCCWPIKYSGWTTNNIKVVSYNHSNQNSSLYIILLHHCSLFIL